MVNTNRTMKKEIPGRWCLDNGYAVTAVRRMEKTVPNPVTITDIIKALINVLEVTTFFMVSS
ncbi:hypothetical protein D3C76_1803140 [compost metagenome]